MKKRHYNQKPLWKRRRAATKRASIELFELLQREIRKEIDQEIIRKICETATKFTEQQILEKE